MSTVRILKIAEVLLQRWNKQTRHSSEQRTAQLRLQGLWLEQAGFKPGELVAVQVEPGRLVITKPEPARHVDGPTPAEIAEQIKTNYQRFNDTHTGA